MTTTPTTAAASHSLVAVDYLAALLLMDMATSNTLVISPPATTAASHYSVARAQSSVGTTATPMIPRVMCVYNELNVRGRVFQRAYFISELDAVEMGLHECWLELYGRHTRLTVYSPLHIRRAASLLCWCSRNAGASYDVPAEYGVAMKTTLDSQQPPFYPLPDITRAADNTYPYRHRGCACIPWIVMAYVL